MSKEKAPWYFLLLLILAGECVFFLPFVLPRIFRPTVLDAFSLDNTQLGLCFSVYGIVAMQAYLFAGPAMGYLLDRSPGVVGHQDVFLMLAFFSFIGGVASWMYYKKFNE